MAKYLVKIRTTVLYDIVDSYERRNESAQRVIGTLLGRFDQNSVEITNSFIVPHTETNDEVAVDIQFAKERFECHKKVYTKEAIVGWYATGADVTPYSIPIHDYYSREISDPVHLTVDTTLKQERMSIKAYKSKIIGMPKLTQGTLFCKCRVEIINDIPEQLGLSLCQKTLFNEQKPVKIDTDLDKIQNHIGDTREYLVSALEYVKDVLDGKREANNQIAELFTELLHSIPQLKNKEVIEANVKDMLLMMYQCENLKYDLKGHEVVSLIAFKRAFDHANQEFPSY